jgi:hypothetical protein
MSASLSRQQLAMYLTPEEIKSHGVHESEYEDHEISEHEVWDRKHTESHDWDRHGYDENPVNLAADIRKRGVQKPVTLDKETDVLRDGYHRVASAKPKSLIPVEYE